MTSEFAARASIAESRANRIESLGLSVGPDEPTADATIFMRNIVTEDTRLWSKAGATGLEWHDASIIELPDGRKYILVVFTHYKETPTPFIALYTRNILEAME